MIVSIGGSASTGSSLLVRMLNRHSKILAGPETSLMARYQLMQSWSQYKHLLCGRHFRKLRNQGWHRYYGIQWDADFYKLSRPDLCRLAKRCASYSIFLTDLEEVLNDHHNSQIWVEKTPANAYGFVELAQARPEAQRVLVVRDPRDAIASMINRGFTPFYASALFLLNTAFGYLPEALNYSVLRYEDLVTDPGRTLTRLLHSWGQSYEGVLLQAENQSVKMQGWDLDETGLTSTSSIGKFARLNPWIQEEVTFFMAHLHIRPAYTCYNRRPGIHSFEKICSLFDYNMPSQPDIKSSRRFKSAFFKEKTVRSLLGYSTGWGNFPVYI